MVSLADSGMATGSYLQDCTSPTLGDYGMSLSGATTGALDELRTDADSLANISDDNAGSNYEDDLEDDLEQLQDGLSGEVSEDNCHFDRLEKINCSY